jgi:hypothetical protein
MLVTPGFRTLPRAGWRSGAATALAVVLANPSLWLLGAIGFAARGGILLLALVIVILPTPVEVRMLLGENLSSSGLTPAFIAFLGYAAAAAALVVLTALLVAARVELAAFERFVNDPESGHQDGTGLSPTAGGARRGVIARLFLVQLAAVTLFALAAVPLALSLYDATLQELMRPTPGGVALYLRVLSAVREPLIVLLIAVVVIDIFTAAASRRVMRRHFGLAGPKTPGESRRRSLRSIAGAALDRPLSSLATSLLAWGVTLVVLVPIAWALDVAWDATRAAYLGQRVDADPQALAWLAVITVAFAATWMAAMIMAGFVSALRASLWSAESLR